MIVWFTPRKIVFFAKGSSTLNKRCRSVDPNDSDVSINFFWNLTNSQICKSNSYYKAKMTEEDPGTIPIPKNATAGIR